MRLKLLRKRWILFLSLVLASSLKLWLLIKDVVPFNSDEAIVALMARHILAGEKPVFFYGQAYMGSLDAWFVAAGFALFGQHVWVIRFVQLVLYLLLIWTTALIGEKVFGSSWVGDISALLLAIPAVNVTLYTTVSLGCYGEGLLIGNLLIILSIHMVAQLQSDGRLNLLLCLAWGILAGIGFWCIALTLIFSAASGIYLLWGLWRFTSRDRRSSQWPVALVLMVGGWLVGALPWLSYAGQFGFGQVMDALFGRGKETFEQASWMIRTRNHFIYLILFGMTVLFGFRPPWEIRWLALPLAPFVLLFWTGVVINIPKLLQKNSRNYSRQILLIGVIVLFLLIFLLTPFGADPSGRYFLPLVVPLAIFSAAFINFLRNKIGSWAWGVLGLILVFHLWGTLQSANHYPPGITTQFTIPSQVDHRYDQALINFLTENGETRGYSNYWVTYPLAFLSEEKLIFIPRLPYDPGKRYSEQEDRYKPYDRILAETDRVAYITTRYPALDAQLVSAFRDRSMNWDEIRIGDYHVFYHLSQLVRPEEIGLGNTTEP